MTRVTATGGNPIQALTYWEDGLWERLRILKKNTTTSIIDVTLMYCKTYSKKSRKKVKFAWLKNPQEKLKELVFLPT